MFMFMFQCQEAVIQFALHFGIAYEEISLFMIQITIFLPKIFFRC